MIQFTNEEVEAKYEATVELDRMIHMHCTYAGMLSNITLTAGDKLYTEKSNLIKLKTVAFSSIEKESEEV